MGSKRRIGFFTLAVALGVVGTLGAATHGYDETTTVVGKIPIDLRGAWLLVANPEFEEGKAKTFVELLTITQQPDGQLSCHLLDVRLPMAAEIREADQNMTRWAPSAEQLAMLRKNWSKLPPQTDKDAVKGDVDYGKIEFRLASPDRYAEVFTKQDAALKQVLSDSTFSLMVLEQYRALPMSPEARIIQLMQRQSIYAFRHASDQLLEGAQVTAFLAAHPLAPLPLNWSGKFTMYRLASAKQVAGVAPSSGGARPAPAAKGRRSAAKKPEPRP